MIRYVNTTASAPLLSRGLYRVTWSAGSVLGIPVGDVRRNLVAIAAGEIEGTGFGFAASQPAIVAGGNAGTLDVRMPVTVRGTVAEFANAMQDLATRGFNLEVTRVELVHAAEGSATAAANRDTATAAAEKAVDAASLAAQLRGGVRTLVWSAVAGLLVYAYVSRKR